MMTQPDIDPMNKSAMEMNTKPPEETITKQLPLKQKTTGCQGIKVFLAALAFSYFSKVYAGAMMKSSITQLERRFGIPSSTAGFIDGGFEMGNLLVIAFVSYFGAKFHRPKIIAFGCFIMSLGSFLMVLPHFFMGYYQYDTISFTSNNISSFSPCLLNPQDSPKIKGMPRSDCDHKIVTSYAWIFVLLGNLLRGIGETPITPLGISYLDDFSREEDVPLYISILHTSAMIGPLFGFLLGSVFARLYVDVGFVDMDAITISPTDARWVGAWWMGFLVAGVIALISGIPFLFLPKSLDKKEDACIQKNLEPMESNAENSYGQKPDIQGGKGDAGQLNEFFKSLKRILGNKLYLLLLCSSLLNTSSFIGYMTYQGKYMEQQYGQSMSRSNFITAVAILPMVLIGMFLSGFIMKKYKLGIISATKMGYTVSFIGFALTFLYLILGCDNHPVAGLTVTYDRNTAAQNQLSLSSACNANCTCSTTQWDPVCGDNGLTYVSACFAGCKNITGLKKETVFHNCSCIEKADAVLKNSSAVWGECRRSDECSKKFIFYTIVKAVSSFLFSLGSVPMYMLFIRSVPQDLKSLAVGLMMLVIRALGGIPAPVYFGAVIDKTCLKWGSNPCGQKGSCRIYDAVQYRYSFYGLITALRAPSFLLGLIFYFLLKKNLRKQEAEKTENECKEGTPLNEEIKLTDTEISARRSDAEMNTCL
ncbi:solute carrier organic anion transporter family member 1B3-like [Pantherophis guttatus]|uniref:Solute carrier organic anion transporter family member n=1 Tax=Pantherophis guttatus TaxID=94885 RepID=A0A6P9E5D0_PANGU|nr:solute carrier organic anion transporter family member 1B3-like [Pantherophis guttatus]